MNPHSFNREKILKALPATVTEIMYKADCSRQTVRYWLGKFKEEEICRVVGYRRARGGGAPPAKIYGLGKGPDAVCRIKPLPKSIIYARNKMKAESSGLTEIRRARERARYWEKRAKAQPANPFTALFVQTRKQHDHK
jgi:hypothetical protein